MQIALIGSAPASVRLAPYANLNWKIYGCSPGVYGVAPRVDEWFETHLWEPGAPWFSPEYCQWLAALPARGVKLWVGGQIDALPGSTIYPFDEVNERYDPQRWFNTSSLFWMVAHAIDQIVEEAKAQGREVNPNQDKMAFYGVDMAAGEEYEMQRAGIHFLVYKAHAIGIEVGIPPESDLFTPRHRYGVDEWTHVYRKYRARKAELEHRLREAETQERMAFGNAQMLRGALDDLNYMYQTWADKSSHVGFVKAPKT